MLTPACRRQVRTCSGAVSALTLEYVGTRTRHMKLDILAIGVHPDDVELSASGTILRHIAMGQKVGLLDLTRGELGTRGNADIRDQEAADAAKVLGVSVRHNVGLKDGFFVQNEASIRAIIPFIRQYQPNIVLANAISDRHPDHGRAAKLIAEACFLSGLSKIETNWEGQSQEKWRPKNVYHYIQDYQLHPDFVVDITPYMDQKMKSIFAYKSQFSAPDSEQYAEEQKTPISGEDFMQFMYAKARVFGRYAGYEFAEGFNVAKPIGVRDLGDLD